MSRYPDEQWFVQEIKNRISRLESKIQFVDAEEREVLEVEITLYNEILKEYENCS